MSERETSPHLAKQKLLNIIKKLDLRLECDSHSNGNLVATARLYNSEQELVSEGAGKGADCLIGAIAESIEHFAIISAQPETPQLLSCHYIVSQEGVKEDGIIRNIPISNDKMACFKLNSLDHSKSIFLPRLLLSPNRNTYEDIPNGKSRNFLSRYSSNSGSAFGCTMQEALLHGINEVIERHLLSLLYMQICGIGSTIKTFTPEENLLANIFKDSNEALYAARACKLFVISDFFGLNFCIALPKARVKYFILTPTGSGCSINLGTAITRAVTEYIQATRLYSQEEQQIDKITYKALSSSNKLLRLVNLEHLNNLTPQKIGAIEYSKTINIESQIATIHRELLAYGKDIYYRTAANYLNDGIVIQVYIPGLERFNIIRNGPLVVPQQILRSTLIETS